MFVVSIFTVPACFESGAISLSNCQSIHNSPAPKEYIPKTSGDNIPVALGGVAVACTGDLESLFWVVSVGDLPMMLTSDRDWESRKVCGMTLEAMTTGEKEC